MYSSIGDGDAAPEFHQILDYCPAFLPRRHYGEPVNEWVDRSPNTDMEVIEDGPIGGKWVNR